MASVGGDLCEFLLDDLKRWLEIGGLLQVCLYSLPSVLRQLRIFVEHFEKMLRSSVIFLSIYRSLTGGHKELYKGTMVL